MQPKEIGELISNLTEAVRDQESNRRVPWEQLTHNYRMARSELACQFHKVLEERDEAFEKGQQAFEQLQRTEHLLNRARQDATNQRDRAVCAEKERDELLAHLAEFHKLVDMDGGDAIERLIELTNNPPEVFRGIRRL